MLLGPESVQASRVWPKDVAAQAGNPVMVHDLVARAFDLLFDEMELIEQDEPLQFQEIRC